MSFQPHEPLLHSLQFNDGDRNIDVRNNLGPLSRDSKVAALTLSLPVRLTISQVSKRRQCIWRKYFYLPPPSHINHTHHHLEWLLVLPVEVTRHFSLRCHSLHSFIQCSCRHYFYILWPWRIHGWHIRKWRQGVRWAVISWLLTVHRLYFAAVACWSFLLLLIRMCSSCWCCRWWWWPTLHFGQSCW